MAVVAVVMAVMAVTCNELRSHDTAQPSQPTQPTPVLQQPSSGGHRSRSRSHESTGISPGPGLRHYYNQSGPSNSQHSQCSKSFISVRRKSCPQIPRSCHLCAPEQSQTVLRPSACLGQRGCLVQKLRFWLSSCRESPQGFT